MTGRRGITQQFSEEMVYAKLTYDLDENSADNYYIGTMKLQQRYKEQVFYEQKSVSLHYNSTNLLKVNV